MTPKEIALSTLEKELIELSERPKSLAQTLLNLMINQQDNNSLHSYYISPLKNFFNKVNKEDYIKQVSNSYTVGKTSKKYTQGKELKRLKNLILTDINLSDIKEEKQEDTDILIHKDNIKNLKDFWVSMKIQSKYKDFYSIPLEATQESVYFDYVGRQYNNFNRLSQADRALTNTPNEMDLSSSVQNIYINQYALINSISYEEALEQFSTHKEYINNKKALREQMSKEIIKLTKKEKEDLLTNKKTMIDLVKEDFTKISFRGYSEEGLKERYKYPEFVLKIFKETKELTKPIQDLINRMDDRLPIKKHIITRATNKKIQKELKILNYRSKLFFYYEYQEKNIRESMLEFVNNPNTKQVHDAIYTETEIDKSKLEKYIKKNTSFTVNL